METTPIQYLVNILKENGGKQLVNNCNKCKQCSTQPITLGYNAVYIVAAVLFDEQNRVLLIQEAKTSCYGKWYLPAGRVEPHESLVSAVKREVAEESGFEIQPEGLICVEIDGASWVRFIFSGKITGGVIKSIENKDSESLQAQWFDNVENIELRNTDVLRLIKQGQQFYLLNYSKKNKQTKILPKLVKQNVIYYRIFFMLCTESEKYVFMILNDDKTHKLPTCCLNKDAKSLILILDVLFSNYLISFSSNANSFVFEKSLIFGVEHCANMNTQNDGMILNCFIKARYNLSKHKTLPKHNSKCQWILITENNELNSLITKTLNFGVTFNDRASHKV